MYIFWQKNYKHNTSLTLKLIKVFQNLLKNCYSHFKCIFKTS